MPNIPKIAADLLSSVERDKALSEYRAKISNKRSHVFHMSVDGFKSKLYLGLSAQRSKKVMVSKRQDEIISEAVKQYADNLYRTFSSGKSSSGKFSYTMIGGNRANFKVRISGDGDIFTHLKRVRSDAGIGRVSNIAKNTFKDIATNKNVAFDLSHMEGTTVAEQFAAEMLKKYESLPGTSVPNKQSYETLKATIKYDPSKVNIAEINVEDTFWYLNQSTTEEAYITSLLRRAIGDKVEKLLPELSSGKIQYVNRALSNVLSKAGAKVSKQKEIKGSSTTKTSKITHKKPKRPSFSGEYIELKDIALGKATQESSKNWSLLVPEINKRLSAKIREHMVAPRLVNRTGAFASSVRVTGVEVTKEGFPSFIADYDRSPYQVFDRTLGGSPWNTPERDPKNLISLAIRDVMRGLAIGRFYVRVPQQEELAHDK